MYLEVFLTTSGKTRRNSESNDTSFGQNAHINEGQTTKSLARIESKKLSQYLHLLAQCLDRLRGFCSSQSKS